MIDTAKPGVGGEDYYLCEITEDEDAYLPGPAEPQGLVGRAAGEAFSLSDAEAFGELGFAGSGSPGR
ncbi:MAG: hypothetical protein ACRDZO_10125 [Egibacteraceae bacterium]